MFDEPPSGSMSDGDGDTNSCAADRYGPTGFAKPLGVLWARPVETDVQVSIPDIPLASLVQRMPMPMSRWRAVLELFLLVPFTWMGAIGVYLIFERWPMEDPRWHSVWENMGLGLSALLVCFVMLRIAGHKAVTIGWTAKEFFINVGIGLGAFVGNFLFLLMLGFAFIFIYPEVLSEPTEAQQAIEQTFPPLSLPLILMMTLIVAFWEEVVFRGFVLTRMHALFGRWWLTVLIGSLIFGGIHFYEGPLAMLVIFMVALVMGGLFVWRKSLVPSIAFHLMHNLVVFMLLQNISTTWQ
ncbi:MAG: lysostaphin resistance A-like protein [Planctomycetota bacterium]|jgi:membrane protease YdiL (CAAX protease family)